MLPAVVSWISPLFLIIISSLQALNRVKLLLLLIPRRPRLIMISAWVGRGVLFPPSLQVNFISDLPATNSKKIDILTVKRTNPLSAAPTELGPATQAGDATAQHLSHKACISGYHATSLWYRGSIIIIMIHILQDIG